MAAERETRREGGAEWNEKQEGWRARKVGSKRGASDAAERRRLRERWHAGGMECRQSRAEPLRDVLSAEAHARARARNRQLQPGVAMSPVVMQRARDACKRRGGDAVAQLLRSGGDGAGTVASRTGERSGGGYEWLLAS
eukprot:2816764-Pleurochrysis_carterae.AAC.2